MKLNETTWDGEPEGNRTLDPKIKSLVLYQLSYGLAKAALPLGWDDKAGPSRLVKRRRGISCGHAAAGAILMIFVGSVTLPLWPCPFLIALTASMPSVTWPTMV